MSRGRRAGTQLHIVGWLHTCWGAHKGRCLPPLQGKFVSFYGKNFTAEEMAKSIASHVQRWEADHK